MELGRDHALIMFEFDKLWRVIQPIAPRGPKTGKLREVVSLTSKALWCCYPNDIPIFDDYTLRALQVICRLCSIFPAPGQSEYGTFSDAWLQIYRKLEPIIEREDLQAFPFKVRVMDGMLWYLGQPSFDEPEQG